MRPSCSLNFCSHSPKSTEDTNSVLLFNCSSIVENWNILIPVLTTVYFKSSIYNKNVSCSGYFDDHCTFKWKEIKKEGNNYIFIILPAPYKGYYSSDNNKIRIENLGLSIGGIIGILIRMDK